MCIFMHGVQAMALAKSLLMRLAVAGGVKNDTT